MYGCRPQRQSQRKRHDAAFIPVSVSSCLEIGKVTPISVVAQSPRNLPLGEPICPELLWLGIRKRAKSNLIRNVSLSELPRKLRQAQS